MLYFQKEPKGESLTFHQGIANVFINKKTAVLLSFRSDSIFIRKVISLQIIPVNIPFAPVSINMLCIFKIK